jgi:hypothetical protein
MTRRQPAFVALWFFVSTPGAVFENAPAGSLPAKTSDLT